MNVANNGYIYAEEWGYGSEPLILLHGFMMKGEMFYPLVEHLGLDFRLLIPDLRGFGKSRDLKSPYTMENMSFDVIKLLDLYSYEKVHLLGYSMGGLVAQDLISKFPQRFKSLTLCCTFSYKAETTQEKIELKMVPFILRKVGATGITRFLSNQMVETMGKLDSKTLNWYKSMLSDNDDSIMNECVKNIFKADYRKQLPKIETPTLIVGGGSDLVAPIHHSHYLAGNIPGARLKIYTDAGHGVLHTHTHSFIKNYLDFIQNLNSYTVKRTIRKPGQS